MPEAYQEDEVALCNRPWVQTSNQNVIAMPDENGDLHLFVRAETWQINGKRLMDFPGIIQEYNNLLAKIAKRKQ